MMNKDSERQTAVVNEIITMIDSINAIRTRGICRSAVIRQVVQNNDDTTNVVILFPDIIYLMSVALILDGVDCGTTKIDGLYLRMTIR